jgi:quercetin dioxygenase-like cupin family protein
MTLSTQLRPRLVRYEELRPCTNAFIDARSPGSDQKENFTIIGPGVAENPRQHVHIREPHGFNIGAARQPPHCTNSLHSHLTEEVFIIHTGQWRFFWGEDGKDGEVLLDEGDTISIPVNMFRGFENVGTQSSFMFAVLGGDDPGRVLWAPHVIEKARGHGLVLLENGSLVDTTLGETVPEGLAAVDPATRAELAQLHSRDDAEMARRVARRTALTPDWSSPPQASGVRESLVIGAAGAGASEAAIPSPHSFCVSRLTIDAGASTPMYQTKDAQVLLVQHGELQWRSGAGDSVILRAGDTFSVPGGMPHSLEAVAEAEAFMVRRPHAGA